MFRWYWTVSPQALAGTILFCGEAVTRGDDEVAAARFGSAVSTSLHSEPAGSSAKLELHWSRRGGWLGTGRNALGGR